MRNLRTCEMGTEVLDDIYIHNNYTTRRIAGQYLHHYMFHKYKFSLGNFAKLGFDIKLHLCRCTQQYFVLCMIVLKRTTTSQEL